MLGISAQRQGADEPGGQDQYPPQAVISVAEVGGTIAYGAGAILADVVNRLFAKISYGVASMSRVGCCGLPDPLQGIPSVANCLRCVKISYDADASRVGQSGVLRLLLEIRGEIRGQEHSPLPTIVYGAGAYRVRAANFQHSMIFYGDGVSRLALSELLDLRLKIPGEFVGWEDSVAVRLTTSVRGLSL